MLALLTLLAPQVAAAVPSAAQRRCILKTGVGFRTVAGAQRTTTARCLARFAANKLPAGQTLGECLVTDGRGLVAAAAKARRLEAMSCAEPPDFGWIAGTSVPEAVAAETVFVQRVLGSHLDRTVPVGAAVARCQRAAVRAAGLCARRFVADYGSCAATALRDAPDASALVRCKGADPRGAIARACGDDLAAVIAKRCSGRDLEAVFPGCAGKPLAPCLAGLAKAASNHALNAIGGLCAVPGPPPPALEPIDLAFVPLPAGVLSPQLPWWTADGARIVFSAELSGHPGVQLATIAPDGSDFRCLTCPLAVPGGAPLLKPIPFPDGTRIGVRVGQQTAVSAADHAVLECSPSVLDCQVPVLVPITPPAAGDAVVVQDQRELRVAPDGIHVGLTQVRADAEGGQTPTSIVGVLQRLADSYEVADPRVVSTLGELKQFSHDDQSVIVAAFNANPFAAANPDAVRIDLADGSVSRVTSHPDYDEPVEFSPDDQWFAVGSGRGGNFFSVFSQVSRPGIVNPALEKLTAFFFLTQRDPLLEPWIVDRYGARGDYIGQQLNPGSRAEGFDGRMIMNWSPDGTRLVFWEVSPTSSRIAIATLSARTPIASPVLPRPMPSLAWAPALSGFVPPVPTTPASRAGMFSGTGQVTYATGTPRHLEVIYSDFSDDGRSFLNGIERAEYTPGLAGSTTYDADLTLHGCSQGFLAAADATITLTTFGGSVLSEVDGKLLGLQ